MQMSSYPLQHKTAWVMTNTHTEKHK